MASLPSNVSYGQIKGRFIAAVADSVNDADRNPDAVPLSGLQIRLTPSIRMAKNVSAVPPVTIFLDPIDCTTDSNGDIVDASGSPGIYVVATDDTDLNPVNWVYGITISGGAGSTVPTQNFNITVPSGSTIDLSSAIPVPANPGMDIPNWQQAINTTKAYRDEVFQGLGEIDDALDDLANLDATLTSAQLAETNAITARNDARTAKTGAETALASANTVLTNTNTALTGAQTARTGAETARTGAETAQTGAQTARTGAETARDETYVSVTNLGTVLQNTSLSQAQTRSKYIKVVLGANVTFTMPAGVAGVAYSCVFRIQQDATGTARSVVFANVQTPYGQPIPLTNSANAVDRITLEWDGAVWSAFLSGPQMSVPTTWTV